MIELLEYVFINKKNHMQQESVSLTAHIPNETTDVSAKDEINRRYPNADWELVDVIKRCYPQTQ